jgi:hypothetical protein
MNPFDLFSHIIWRPGIGDNTWWGWTTVALYYGTALLAGLVYTAQRRTRRAGRFYLAVALLLLGLGLARQTGLLRWLTELGRTLAWQEGWYGARWPVQRQLVQGGIYGGIGLFLLLTWLNRRTLQEHGALLAGLIGLLSFVAIRAISLHQVDAWLSRRRMGVPINMLLEGGTLLWIALALAVPLWYQKRRLATTVHADLVNKAPDTGEWERSR